MKVLVSGYYGFGNAGDELILENIISGFRKSPGNIELTVLSADPEKTTREHGVRAISRWNPLRVFSALLGNEVILSGGGGLFQDATGSLSLYYYLLLIVIARVLGKKIFIYAAGVNELRGINKGITAQVLNLSMCVTVREQDSYDLLLSWGCRKNLLELTADPVLLSDIAGARTPGGAEKKRKIVFIVRPPRSGRWPVETFARVADVLTGRLEAEAVFIPFQPKNDLPFARRIAEEMRITPRLFAGATTAAVVREMRGADLVVSQRLHGLIIALLMGTPAVGISDDPKIARFLKETGQKNISGIGQAEPDAVIAEIMDTWEWRDDLKANAQRLLPVLAARARRARELFIEKAK